MTTNGRWGARNPHSKLTDADVAAIRLALSSGVRQCDIAAKYGVTGAAVSAIKNNRTWSGKPSEKPRAKIAAPVRPTTVVDGVEFEVVWYPHRDALPLLSEDYPSINGAPLDTLDLSRVLRQTFGGSKWGQE